MLYGPKSSDADMKESTILSYHKVPGASDRDIIMGWMKHEEDSDVLVPMRRKEVTVGGNSCLEGSE